MGLPCLRSPHFVALLLRYDTMKAYRNFIFVFAFVAVD